MRDPIVSDSPSDSLGPRARRCVVRGFIGHIESLGTTFREVAAALATQPTVAPEGWGSAYADDPWPRPLPADLPESTRVQLRQHYQTQLPERAWTLTFVTRTSQSLVSLEDHEGALVLALTYDPAAATGGELPTDLATNSASDLPTDVPEDVRAALGGRQFVVATTLYEQLFAEPSGRATDDRVTTLLGLAAVWDDDLRLADTLRRIARQKADDWALRAAGIAVARRAGYLLLLHELWAGEADAELSYELTALLSDEPAGPTSAVETGGD